MEVINAVGLFILVVSSIVVLTIIEKKYNINLGMNMSSYNDMSFWGYDNKSTNKLLAEKDETIAQLTERVEVLERIVTDPAEQLKREIDQL